MAAIGCIQRHDDVDYRVEVGSGTIDAKIVILAAGAGATPVILQRSEASLGPMPSAVGRYFSGNGERLNTAIINEDRVRDVLGLMRADGIAYEAYQIGKGPCVATWDRLDGSLPEFSRYSLEQLYFPPAWARSSRRHPMRPDRPGSVWRRRKFFGAGVPG